MKSGAGDDPFAEESDVEAAESSEEPEVGESMVEEPAEPSSGSQGLEDIPYKFRRDRVKDDREPMTIFLQEETEKSMREFYSDLEAEVDEQVSKIDAHEAAVIAAQRNPEIVAEVLREWGYDFE